MPIDNMLTIARQIKMHYERGELTEHQFKVLIGLIAHDDHRGALKGMHKILRRRKREREAAAK